MLPGNWIAYKDQHPDVGFPVLYIRDHGDDLEYCADTWTESLERFADMNSIVYWTPIYPPTALVRPVFKRSNNTPTG